jgi:hypothetical protein
MRLQHAVATLHRTPSAVQLQLDDERKLAAAHHEL